MYLNAYFACSEPNQDLLMIAGILDKYMIKYTINDWGHGRRYMTFNVSFDSAPYNEIVSIPAMPKPLLTAVYSDEELEGAEWLLARSRCGKIESADENITFELTRCCAESGETVDFTHRIQTGPFVLKRPVKWKNSNNFCGDCQGGLYRLFCSDRARSAFEKECVCGIEYMPAILADNGKAVPDINQLRARTLLGREALILGEEFEEEVCPVCGEPHYIINNTEVFSIGVRRDAIPKDSDICITDSIFVYEDDRLHGFRLTFVSQKFYRTVAKVLKDKSLYFVPATLK